MLVITYIIGWLIILSSAYFAVLGKLDIDNTINVNEELLRAIFGFVLVIWAHVVER